VGRLLGRNGSCRLLEQGVGVMQLLQQQADMSHIAQLCMAHVPLHRKRVALLYQAPSLSTGSN
jgi:hypothetical protein